MKAIRKYVDNSILSSLVENKISYNVNNESKRDENQIKINVLVIGKSQVGKTTFINFLLHGKQWKNHHSFFTQKRLIGNGHESCTAAVGLYTVVFPMLTESGRKEVTLNIYDTPGIQDSSGMDHRNMKDVTHRVLGWVKSGVSFNGIFMVCPEAMIDGDPEMIKSLRFYKSLFHSVIDYNLTCLFTRVRYSPEELSFMAENGSPLMSKLQKYSAQYAIIMNLTANPDFYYLNSISFGHDASFGVRLKLLQNLLNADPILFTMPKLIKTGDIRDKHAKDREALMDLSKATTSRMAEIRGLSVSDRHQVLTLRNEIRSLSEQVQKSSERLAMIDRKTLVVFHSEVINSPTGYIIGYASTKEIFNTVHPIQGVLDDGGALDNLGASIKITGEDVYRTELTFSKWFWRGIHVHVKFLCESGIYYREEILREQKEIIDCESKIRKKDIEINKFGAQQEHKSDLLRKWDDLARRLEETVLVLGSDYIGLDDFMSFDPTLDIVSEFINMKNELDTSMIST